MGHKLNYNIFLPNPILIKLIKKSTTESNYVASFMPQTKTSTDRFHD